MLKHCSKIKMIQSRGFFVVYQFCTAVSKSTQTGLIADFFDLDNTVRVSSKYMYKSKLVVHSQNPKYIQKYF